MGRSALTAVQDRLDRCGDRTGFPDVDHFRQWRRRDVDGERFAAVPSPCSGDGVGGTSATGQHQMYSVFVEAQRGTITVNGAPLPGKIIERNFLDRRMSTAFLAFSETWITPPH